MTTELEKLIAGLKGKVPGEGLGKTNYDTGWYDPSKDTNALIDADTKTYNEEDAKIAAQMKADIDRIGQRPIELAQLLTDTATAVKKVQEVKTDREEGRAYDLKEVSLEGTNNKGTLDKKSISSDEQIDKDKEITNDDDAKREETNNNTKELLKKSSEITANLNEVKSKKNVKNIENEKDLGKQSNDIETYVAAVNGSPASNIASGEINNAFILRDRVTTFIMGKDGGNMLIPTPNFPNGISLAKAIEEHPSEVAQIQQQLGNIWYSYYLKNGGKPLNKRQQRDIIRPAMKELRARLVNDSNEISFEKAKHKYNIDKGIEIANIINGVHLDKTSGVPISLFGTKEYGYKNSWLYQNHKAFPSKEGEHIYMGALREFVSMAASSVENGFLDPHVAESLPKMLLPHKGSEGKTIALNQLPWVKKSNVFIHYDKAVNAGIIEKSNDAQKLQTANIIKYSEAARIEFEALNPKEQTEENLRIIGEKYVAEAKLQGISIDIQNPYWTFKNTLTVEDIADKDTLQKIAALVPSGKGSYGQIQKLIGKINDVKLQNTTNEVYRQWFESDTNEASQLFNDKILPKIMETTTMKNLQSHSDRRALINRLRTEYYGRVDSWAGAVGEDSVYNNEHLMHTVATFIKDIENHDTKLNDLIDGSSIAVQKQKHKIDTNFNIENVNKLGSDIHQLSNWLGSKEFYPGEQFALQQVFQNPDFTSTFYNQLFKKTNFRRMSGIPIYNAKGEQTGTRKAEVKDIILQRIVKLDDAKFKEITGMAKEEALVKFVNHYKQHFGVHGGINKILQHFDIPDNSSGLISVAAADKYAAALTYKNNTVNTIELNPNTSHEDLSSTFSFYKKDKKASEYTLAEVGKLLASGKIRSIGKYNISFDDFANITEQFLINPANPNDNRDKWENMAVLKFTPDIQRELILRAGLLKANKSAMNNGALTNWLQTKYLSKEDIKSLSQIFKTKSFLNSSVSNPNSLVTGVSSFYLFYTDD